MRSRLWAVVATTVVVAGGVVGTGGSAGAVTASFAATCVTQSGAIPISTTHRSISYEVHAPDSVAPGTTFDVPVSFGYAIPSNAQVGGAFVDITGRSTVLLDGVPGTSEISGTVTATALGGAGSVVEVSLQKLAAFAQLGGSAVGEVCTPDHTLVLARVAVGMPLVSVGDAAVVEGASGTRALEFAVSLSRPSATPVTVAFDTEDGTATAGSDYVARSGSVTVPPGSVSAGAAVAVRVRGDRTVEPKENLRVRLHDPVGAALGRAVGTGRIIDDDPSTGTRLSVGDGSVVEGAHGTRSARFTVSLAAPATERVTFHFSASDGTAVAGRDYGAASYDGSIEPGATSTTWPVTVVPNGTADGDRTFSVHLTEVSGATIGRANGIGTIIDDD
jgi:hypothetical protein